MLRSLHYAMFYQWSREIASDWKIIRCDNRRFLGASGFEVLSNGPSSFLLLFRRNLTGYTHIGYYRPYILLIFRGKVLVEFKPLEKFMLHGRISLFLFADIFRANNLSMEFLNV